jgi:glutaredoxin
VKNKCKFNTAALRWVFSTNIEAVVLVEFHNSEEEEEEQQQQQEQQQKQKPVRQRALHCNEGRIRISLGKQI